MGKNNAEKINRTVVRNAAYRSDEFNIRHRHNERKNENYHNGDIDLSRSHLNHYFHEHLKFNEQKDIVEAETYEETFNRFLDEGIIVKRGLKPDAKVFDEMIFDVNTAYFEENGGYEYAKQFFAEAYKCAVKEIGGEQYVISAVMHADEINRALSDELGREVYHYHLHVVYVPVVQKEILWSKRIKDKSLVGKVKEVIPQISHSKKWPMRVPVERDVKTILLNSYSLLQDRFFEHMQTAGFDGFERGERGSTREHLSDLDYKIQQDKQRLAEIQKQAEALNRCISEKKKAAADIAAQVREQQPLLDEISKHKQEIETLQAEKDTLKTEIKTEQKNFKDMQLQFKPRKDDLDKVNRIAAEAKPAVIGNRISVTKDDWDFIVNIAKQHAKISEATLAAFADQADITEKLKDCQRLYLALASEVAALRWSDQEQLKHRVQDVLKGVEDWRVVAWLFDDMQYHKPSTLNEILKIRQQKLDKQHELARQQRAYNQPTYMPQKAKNKAYEHDR